MKKRKSVTIVIYILLLALSFSWMIALFAGKGDDVSYSRIVTLFEQKQVKSFVVKDNQLELKLHTPYDGKTTLTVKLAFSGTPRASRTVWAASALAAGSL